MVSIASEFYIYIGVPFLSAYKSLVHRRRPFDDLPTEQGIALSCFGENVFAIPRPLGTLTEVSHPGVASPGAVAIHILRQKLLFELRCRSFCVRLKHFCAVWSSAPLFVLSFFYPVFHVHHFLRVSQYCCEPHTLPVLLYLHAELACCLLCVVNINPLLCVPWYHNTFLWGFLSSVLRVFLLSGGERSVRRQLPPHVVGFLRPVV